MEISQTELNAVRVKTCRFFGSTSVASLRIIMEDS
jgi:hypothetical protein